MAQSSNRPRPASNVYTVLSLVAFLTLACGVGYLVYKNTTNLNRPWYDVGAWFAVEQSRT